jgi:hypothetical protein
MKFVKSIIHRMGMPYAIGAFGGGRQPGGPGGARTASVVCATEDHGPAVIIDPPYERARTLVAGPGGCMALVSDPDRPSDLWAVMGCFVGYKFQGGGIYRIRDGSPAERAADLPFAHRIGIVNRGGSRYLVAANLAEDKADAADWSRPGAVHAAELTDPAAPLALQPILPGIHRNHGFLVSRLEGHPAVLIGCAEGLLAVDLDSTGPQWPFRQVLSQEVSEMAVADLDGDGSDELVTIEPFHGAALRAYRRSAAGWEKFWETEISFGHCVLAETFDGRPSVLVSNRSGSKDLVLFQFDGDSPSRPRRIVVEPGAAAANMLVLPWEGRDRIFSANQAAGEIVMYTPVGER